MLSLDAPAGERAAAVGLRRQDHHLSPAGRGGARSARRDLSPYARAVDGRRPPFPAATSRRRCFASGSAARPSATPSSIPRSSGGSAAPTAPASTAFSTASASRDDLGSRFRCGPDPARSRLSRRQRMGGDRRGHPLAPFQARSAHPRRWPPRARGLPRRRRRRRASRGGEVGRWLSSQPAFFDGRPGRRQGFRWPGRRGSAACRISDRVPATIVRRAGTGKTKEKAQSWRKRSCQSDTRYQQQRCWWRSVPVHPLRTWQPPSAGSTPSSSHRSFRGTSS